METRMYGDIKEHRHPETDYDYWHPAIRRHVSKDKTVKHISICIEYADGNVVERDIDLNQTFVFDIMQAIKNNKDPIDAMILLSYIGSEHLAVGEHKNAREHIIGTSKIVQ